MKLITNRLVKILIENPIIHGLNESVLPGKSTEDILNLTNSMIEYAKIENKELFLLFLDTKKAFDSVNYEMLTKSFERIKIPKKYIKLISNLNSKRKLNLITSYGVTDYFSAEKGLAQGGVECPLHWLIFYDPLLSRIREKHVGFIMSAESINPLKELKLKIELKIPVFAFVDDTTVVSKSLNELKEIAETTETWDKIIV